MHFSTGRNAPVVLFYGRRTSTLFIALGPRRRSVKIRAPLCEQKILYYMKKIFFTPPPSRRSPSSRGNGRSTCNDKIFMCMYSGRTTRFMRKALKKGCFCVFCEIRNIGDWNDGVCCRVYGDVKKFRRRFRTRMKGSCVGYVRVCVEVSRRFFVWKIGMLLNIFVFN